MSIIVSKKTLISNGLIQLLDPSSKLNQELTSVEVLVIGGGGSGGSGEANPAGDGAGGGGAGGVVYEQSYSVTPGTGISVVVGNGGAAIAANTTSQFGNVGQNSSFGYLTAFGGGRGGAEESSGGTGGSGGGGGGSCTSGRKAGGSATQPLSTYKGFGNRGGTGGDVGCSRRAGAGGGGAGGPGGDDRGSLGGLGGPGLPFSISGTYRYYAGGGGGGHASSNSFNDIPVGGIGGGGAGGVSPSGPGSDGEYGTGSGGGAAGSGTGSSGAGGRGIVIVRYPGTQKASGGSTINYIDGHTIHVFASGGTFTPYSAITNGAYPTGMYDLSGNNNHMRSRAYYENQFTVYGSSNKGVLGNNAVTFTVQGTGTFVRQGYDQVYGSYKIKRSDVVYRYDSPNVGCHYHGMTKPILANNWLYFESEYYIGGDTTGYPLDGTSLVVENYGGGALSSGAGVQNNLKNIWQQHSFLTGPTGSSGTQAMFLYPGGCSNRRLFSNGGSGGFVLYKNPRVEFRDRATPILPAYDSTDASGSLVLDGTYAYLVKNYFPFPEDDFTVGIWVKSSSGTATQGLISYASYSSDNEFLLYDSAVHVRGTAASVGYSWYTGSWVYVTVTRNTSGEVKTYRNGTLITTVNLTAGKLTAGGSLCIGAEQDAVGTGEYGGGLATAQMFSGKIGNVHIYDRILSDQEISQNFSALRGRFGV
jgi:hypothetical protein